MDKELVKAKIVLMAACLVNELKGIPMVCHHDKAIACKLVSRLYESDFDPTLDPKKTSDFIDSELEFLLADSDYMFHHED